MSRNIAVVDGVLDQATIGVCKIVQQDNQGNVEFWFIGPTPEPELRQRMEEQGMIIKLWKIETRQDAHYFNILLRRVDIAIIPREPSSPSFEERSNRWRGNVPFIILPPLSP